MAIDLVKMETVTGWAIHVEILNEGPKEFWFKSRIEAWSFGVEKFPNGFILKTETLEAYMKAKPNDAA